MSLEQVKDAVAITVKSSADTLDGSNTGPDTIDSGTLDSRTQSFETENGSRKWYEKLFRTAGTRSKEEKAFVRKLDIYLLTWGCIAYTIKSIDQSNYSNAYVSGMKESLNIVGNEYNWIATYFTIGYSIGLIPAQIFMTQFKTQYWLSSCELLWGVLTLTCAFAKSAHSLYPMRFFIGLLEASAWPGMMTIFYNYYTEAELATRAALFTGSYYAGSMFTGFMQASIHSTLNGKSGLQGWQWLFIINGLMTVVIAFFGVLALPDSPANGGARWMTPDELALANKRMDRIGRVTKRQFKPSNFFKVLIDYRLWLFMLAYVPAAWANGNGYFNLYLKSVTNADGTPKYSVAQLNLMPIVGNAAELITVLVFSKLSDQFKKKLPFLVIGNGLVTIGTIILICWPKGVGVKFFSFVLLYCGGANTPILISCLPIIWPKETDLRAIATGIIVSMVYANNAWIPLYVWPASQAPLYKYGFKVSIGFQVASLLGIFLFIFLVFNKCQKQREKSIV